MLAPAEGVAAPGGRAGCRGLSSSSPLAQACCSQRAGGLWPWLWSPGQTSTLGSPPASAEPLDGAPASPGSAPDPPGDSDSDRNCYKPLTIEIVASVYGASVNLSCLITVCGMVISCMCFILSTPLKSALASGMFFCSEIIVASETCTTTAQNCLLPFFKTQIRLDFFL